MRRGEILGLIGASGSGKTTLLNLLVGFIPVTKGQIYVNVPFRSGKKTYDVKDQPLLVNKLYGFASQRPSFYEKLTVRENLAYFGAMYSLSPDAVRKNTDILLRLLELTMSQHVLADHLSGGMKRRLDIACALVHNPSILILDEPTADLDPVLRNQIWEIVKRINMKGTTIILSSHHLNELDTLCSRIAILKNGKLADLDTPDKLKLRYNKEQEIMIESYPGNYANLTDDIKKKNVSSIATEGTYLIIRTEEPEKIITDILSIMKKHREALIDIKLNKPNLDDVFCSIYGKEEAKKFGHHVKNKPAHATNIHSENKHDKIKHEDTLKKKKLFRVERK
ncbi:ABC transporter ATP-binding protein [Candidatus Woesearchaeota archaeon]|nr:ABC transporter ATP-binding protein [Candidatus Woesearchaeota archaeon]